MCGKRHQGGATACSNDTALPLVATERAVLNQVQAAVLDKRIAEQIMASYREQVKADQAAKPEKVNKGLTQQITQAAAEVSNLVAAVKAGGDIPALVVALRQAQARLTDLTARRGRLASPGLSEKDLDELTHRFMVKLCGLATTLRKKPEAGRDVLKTLLAGRLTFNGRAFQGVGTLENLLAGIVPVRVRKSLVHPLGCQAPRSPLR